MFNRNVCMHKSLFFNEGYAVNLMEKKAGSRGGSPRKSGSGRESLPAGSKGRSP